MIPAPPDESPRAEALALPRPNLGPEPWSDGHGAGGWIAAALAAVALVLARLAWNRRRRRGRSPSPPRLAADAPPEDRLLALCDHLRADLAAKLGPTLRARTTEELTADPRVVALLGDDLPRLGEILAEGDRLKFARRPAADLADRLPGWADWVASRR